MTAHCTNHLGKPLCQKPAIQILKGQDVRVSAKIAAKGMNLGKNAACKSPNKAPLLFVETLSGKCLFCPAVYLAGLRASSRQNSSTAGHSAGTTSNIRAGHLSCEILFSVMVSIYQRPQFGSHLSLCTFRHAIFSGMRKNLEWYSLGMTCLGFLAEYHLHLLHG